MLDLGRLYNLDCMIGMAQFPDGYFDLAIVDPEYGREQHGGKDRSTWATQKDGSRIWVKDGGYPCRGWDYAPAGEEYFRELMRVSKNQIIWGVNYFSFPFGPGRIVWDKCNDGSDQSQCEIAYNSMTQRVDIFRFLWRGMFQGKNEDEGTVQQGNKKLNEKRIHPCQKPIPLYRWILKKYASKGWKLLDTHVGSASSLIAFYQMGFDFVGFEVDQVHFTDGMERLCAHTAQTRLY